MFRSPRHRGLTTMRMSFTWRLWYSGLGIHQLGSRPTFFIPRWTKHRCILYQVCDARRAWAVVWVYMLQHQRYIHATSPLWSVMAGMTKRLWINAPPISQKCDMFVRDYVALSAYMQLLRTVITDEASMERRISFMDITQTLISKFTMTHNL